MGKFVSLALLAVLSVLLALIILSGCAQIKSAAPDAKSNLTPNIAAQPPGWDKQETEIVEGTESGEGTMAWNVPYIEVNVPLNSTVKVENLTLSNIGNVSIVPQILIMGEIARRVKGNLHEIDVTSFNMETIPVNGSSAIMPFYVTDGYSRRGPLYFKGDEICMSPRCCTGNISARLSSDRTITAQVDVAVRICTQNITVQKSIADICEEEGGHLCAEHEMCESPTVNLSETDRCCKQNCTDTAQFEFSSKRHCTLNPYTGQINYCYCEPNMQKNRVAVVVPKGSIYDSASMESQVAEYYAAVSKDLDIGNAGLKRFEGTTIDELDRFVDSLYLDDDVGYIILVGESLPVSAITETNTTNFTAMYDKLSCIGKDCQWWECWVDNDNQTGCQLKGERTCRDVAISYILPPVLYSDDEKLEFVLKVFRTYAGYHDNFPAISEAYPKSILHISHPFNSTEFSEIVLPPSAHFAGEAIEGYGLPVISFLNIEFDRINIEMKNKRMILRYDAHGAPTGVGMGLNNEPYSILKTYADMDYTSLVQESNRTSNYTTLTNYWDLMYTDLEEYSNFTRDNGLPALFVDAYACNINVMRQENVRYCCWPQVMMDSGVWAYYSMFEPGYESLKIRDGIANETIGMASRKYIVLNHFVFGDILAHVK